MMFRLVCLLVVVTVVSAAIYCPPNACENRECKDVSCAQNERRKEKGDACGCCTVCVRQIPQGESCAFLKAPGPQRRGQECEEGTSCSGERYSETCQ